MGGREWYTLGMLLIIKNMDNYSKSTNKQSVIGDRLKMNKRMID